MNRIRQCSEWCNRTVSPVQDPPTSFLLCPFSAVPEWTKGSRPGGGGAAAGVGDLALGLGGFSELGAARGRVWVVLGCRLLGRLLG